MSNTTRHDDDNVDDDDDDNPHDGDDGNVTYTIMLVVMLFLSTYIHGCIFQRHTNNPMTRQM